MAPPPRPPIICYDLQSSANARRTCCARQPRVPAEERERTREHRRRQLAIEAELDAINLKLEQARRAREDILGKIGTGHTNAIYIRKQDEDYAQLRKKVDQFAATRSKELDKRIKQMQRYQQLQQQIQDKEAEERRLKEMSTQTTPRRSKQHTLNLSTTISSPATNTTKSISTTSTASSSSPTISISSCSSPMSAVGDEPQASVHFVESPPSSKKSTYSSNNSRRQQQQQNSNLLSSTILSTSNRNKSYINTSPNASHIARKPYSFYKQNPLSENETLEVTDIDFFEKVEDKTMLEVTGLVYKMRSALKELEQEMQ